MANRIYFTIVDGAPPFEAELIGSSIPKKIFNSVGSYYIYNIENGVYTLKITDGNGCVFEKEVIVNPNVTTTTTTFIPDYSILIGNSQDPITIFNPNATNRNSQYIGYPDQDVVELYLWFKTLDGKPLESNKVLTYEISSTGGTALSTFKYDSVSDEIHTEVNRDVSGPATLISGNIILKPGFIESFFKYYYYRNGTNKEFNISIGSNNNIIYPLFNTRFDENKTYGIESISKSVINFNY